MTTLTTKAAARKAYQEAKLAYQEARAEYAKRNQERADLLKTFHYESEENDCDVACRNASGEKGRARANYLAKKAYFKSLSRPSAHISSPTCHVMLVAA